MPDTDVLDISIIPAAPGYSVYYPSKDDRPDDLRNPLFRHPVVAWRIITRKGAGRSANGEVWSDSEPVVVGDEVSDDYFIVRPSGIVDWPGNGSYKSIADAWDDFSAPI